MRRLYLVAVAGLCSFAPVRAQEGRLAPTAPVVPAPVLQNGNLLTPAGGNGGWGAGSGPRTFVTTRWSPFRSPVTASVGEPAGAPTGAPAGYGYSVPPLPAGVGGADGSCGTGGCAPARGRNGSCWEKLKNWLCYHPSNTDLPRCQPTPYIVPLQGMFPCTASWGGGCGTCAGGYGQPWYGAPGSPIPAQPMPPPMVPPMTPPAQPGTGAAAVTMPPRGMQGTAVAPTWQGRVAPMPATGIPGYRFATPEATATRPAALPGTVVTTSAKVP